MELFWILFWRVIDEFAKWAKAGKKRISIATFHMRCKYLAREFHRLRTGKLVKLEDGKVVSQPPYKLAKPENLKRKHIDALLADWLARGLSTSYIHNMLSMLRVFCSWIQKPGLVPATADVVPDRNHKRRQQTATRDKSWAGCGINSIEKLKSIAETKPRIAMTLDLMRVFGLRFKEASLLRPCLADQGVYLDICRGTKGGRDRTHVIDTAEQRDLIERTKVMIGDKEACLIPRGMSYRQWQNHVYYVLRTHGITRKEIGTSAYGLRHERLNNLYEDHAGGPSPVRGGKPGDVSLEADRFARQQVAEVAGHGRRRVSSAYLGGVLQEIKRGSRAASTQVKTMKAKYDKEPLNQVGKEHHSGD